MEPSGTTNRLHALWALLVPQSGAFFGTMSGEAKTVATILLAPGGGLSSYQRGRALAHPFVSCSVRGDSETWRPAPSPDDFNRTTLLWAIDNASGIAIWSAPFPQFADDVARWGIDAANSGARFILTIETAAGRVAEWAALARRWKRRAASLRFFGRETAEAVQ